jgi:hypothetical protein
VIHLAQLRHDIRRGMNANVEDKVLKLCYNTEVFCIHLISNLSLVRSLV